MKKEDKEFKDKVDEIVKKIDDNRYKILWNDLGVPKFKEESKISQGKLSRAAGSRFELKVRNDLESQGRIVDKWTNNVDLDSNKVVPAKRKYNPFMKALVIGTGFPDFISIKKINENSHLVNGIEVKMNGILSKKEKEKCAWYLKNGIFSDIWIAKKGEKRGTIDYVNFKERFPKFL